jgi:hypothetical protein
MKNLKMNQSIKIIIAILIVGIIGSTIIKIFEYIFGVANVFYFAVIVVSIVGVIVVPTLQIINYYKK